MQLQSPVVVDAHRAAAMRPQTQQLALLLHYPLVYNTFSNPNPLHQSVFAHPTRSQAVYQALCRNTACDRLAGVIFFVGPCPSRCACTSAYIDDKSSMGWPAAAPKASAPILPHPGKQGSGKRNLSKQESFKLSGPQLYQTAHAKQTVAYQAHKQKQTLSPSVLSDS